MSRYRLDWYKLKEMDDGSWLVMFPLGDLYSDLVDQAFPEFNHIGWQRLARGVTYTYIKGASSRQIAQLKMFLVLLKKILVLHRNNSIRAHFEDELDQCFALDYTMETLGMWTVVGTLEAEAEGYSDRSDRNRIDELARRLAIVCRWHPNLGDVDRIAAVPGDPGKSFHKPDALVEQMGKQLDRETGLDLRKTKSTPAMKSISLRKKIEAIETIKNVLCLGENIEDKSILLVDNLYQSGITMWTIARFLKDKGAKSVYGLACVKSWRDRDNIRKMLRAMP